MVMYEPGTLKVAWVDKKDSNRLKSRMYMDKDKFHSFCKALEGAGFRFMAMKLIYVEDDYYEWEILPVGKDYQVYRGLTKMLK